MTALATENKDRQLNFAPFLTKHIIESSTQAQSTQSHHICPNRIYTSKNMNIYIVIDRFVWQM